jgi:methionine-S-sulfoxide reductase
MANTSNSSQRKTELAIFAAGCFWGVEEIFRKANGVIATRVGYTGGKTEHPTYETVKTGKTGHAEAIEIEYDPKVVSYDDLLNLFFRLHDPTTLNRQGNDIGTQYRSTIFYSDEDQRIAASEKIKSLNEMKKFARPIATTIEKLGVFYSAEEYHQKYLQKNPGGYNCHYLRD